MSLIFVNEPREKMPEGIPLQFLPIYNSLNQICDHLTSELHSELCEGVVRVGLGFGGQGEDAVEIGSIGEYPCRDLIEHW